MNFFEPQDQARRSSKLLLFLFSIAVLLIIALINFLILAIVLVFNGFDVYTGFDGTWLASLSLETHLKICLSVVTVVLVAVIYRFG